MTCENGHFRAFRKQDDFRRGGRFAGAFSARTVSPEVARGAPERLVDPGERRRTETLEDADRCALCGTPPAQHPFRPDDDVRTDRDLWAWLQRFRPAVFADVAQAAAVAHAAGGDARGWRLTLPSAVRERIVEALHDSALTTDHVIPPAHLVAIAHGLTKREREFAVNGLLLAACAVCVRHRHAPHDVRGAMRAYVDGMYGGDVALARADAVRFRTMEKIAFAVARAHAAAQRSA